MNKKSKELRPYLDKRPWGSMKRFTLNEKSTVKLVRIRPGKRNSLQYHLRRKEFWYILDGRAKLQVGEKIIIAKPGDCITVPVRRLHRWEALEKAVTLLEVSYGRYDENDIVRIEDDYGRVANQFV